MKYLVTLTLAVLSITSAFSDTVNISPGSATRVNSTAYEASRVLKSSSGILLSVVGYNSKGTAQFIQLFDAASLPADGVAPILTFQVPATSPFTVEMPFGGLPFTTGLVISNSSTGPTKTIGSADCWFLATVQ